MQPTYRFVSTLVEVLQQGSHFLWLQLQPERLSRGFSELIGVHLRDFKVRQLHRTRLIGIVLDCDGIIDQEKSYKISEKK
jgi:hypothetical protein